MGVYVCSSVICSEWRDVSCHQAIKSKASFPKLLELGVLVLRGFVRNSDAEGKPDWAEDSFFPYISPMNVDYWIQCLSSGLANDCGSL